MFCCRVGKRIERVVFWTLRCRQMCHSLVGLGMCQHSSGSNLVERIGEFFMVCRMEFVFLGLSHMLWANCCIMWLVVWVDREDCMCLMLWKHTIVGGVWRLLDE